MTWHKLEETAIAEHEGGGEAGAGVEVSPDRLQWSSAEIQEVSLFARRLVIGGA